MSSSDIQKIAVFDDRIVQMAPKYAVEKGALSLTNSPFNAIAANGSQHTYQIQVPSENVFVDRAIDWTSTCFLSLTVSVAGTFILNEPVLKFGTDCALAPFPLHSLTQTLTATINDTTTTMNTNDVLREVLRLTDLKKNREQRTCPTFLDTYRNYNDCFGTINSPLNGYENATTSETLGNGAYSDVFFTDSNGNKLIGNGSYTIGAAPQVYNYINGVPVGVNINGSAPPALLMTYPLFIAFKSTEKVILSPFIFSDLNENETGLFGIQNIQLVFNMNSPSLTGLNGRVLRSTINNGRTLSNLSYNISASVNGNQSPFGGSVVNVQFLTPSLDLALPPKSIVNYMEFPRYVSAVSGLNVVSQTMATSVNSQTITLPQIPDMMIIYVKPQSYTLNDADYYYPIRKISINFDNYSGMLSSHTPEELYRMSYANGLHMDFQQWLGEAKMGTFGSNVPLTGGFLVLRPSKDIVLQTGQAPSLVGNFTFQCQVDFFNTNTVGDPNLTNVNLWIITCNSGFFETVKGSSRILKGVLSESDIINAPIASMQVRGELNRVVGGASFKNMLGNAMSKAQSILPIVKMVAPLIKPMLPQPAQAAMSAVGFGATGAAETGAGITGARYGRKQSLSARLM
jgi:hypothetical protein